MKVGVLALQGAFREHIKKLHQLGIEAEEIRLPRQLEGLDGLIIPGGESTTMGNLAEAFHLVEPLREFRRHKPVWGTCAGLILLAERAQHLKRGGQPLLGGLDITVDRNYFGRQVDSFEIDLPVPALAAVASPGDPEGSFHAIFIRAPAVTEVGPEVEVLARIPDGPIVAVRQGHLLGTAFHPELSKDLRFHRYFAALVAGALRRAGNGQRHSIKTLG
ncbi:MAG: pyridoxal 5'-phosphate synthase glutaminase subunit PdxT [Caldilineae bacterium]|nr:MAG: pyridoxal 5'-phosphate synthase glutaminase subunit PdxT [Caldilineae bacterium]